MHIRPLSQPAAQAANLAEAAAGPAKPTADQRKMIDSCKQFEASLWRGMLEKALAKPGGKEAAGGDVYQYFLGDTIANKMAGQQGGLATALQAQLTPHHTPSPSSAP